MPRTRTAQELREMEKLIPPEPLKVYGEDAVESLRWDIVHERLDNQSKDRKIQAQAGQIQAQAGQIANLQQKNEKLQRALDDINKRSAKTNSDPNVAPNEMETEETDAVTETVAARLRSVRSSRSSLSHH